MLRRALLLLAIACLLPLAARADVSELVGKWQGKVEMPDGLVPVFFEVRLENGEPVFVVGNYHDK